MTGRGGGSILPRMFAVLAMVGLKGDVFSREAVRLRVSAAAAVRRLVDSIMPCMDAEMALVAAEAADLKGEVGLSGEVGREKALLTGERDLIGDCGRVRELCERGDRTVAVLPVRDIARGGAATAFPRVFFATGSVSETWSSFSLSAAMCISDDLRFFPRAGEGCGRFGEAEV